MAQSQYYNSKDKAFVTDAQTQMNALGAGLKSDGLWGPKTEAAYTKYSGQVNLSAGAPTTTPAAGGASPQFNALTGSIDLPAGMDPNDPLLGLKHIHAQNVQDIKDRGKGDRQAIQNASLAKGMSSSSVPLSQMADQRGGEGKALERQGNQLAVDAVGHLQQLRRDQEARDFEREKFTWAKQMDTENLKLARHRAYSSAPKAPKSAFDNATADQNKAYYKAYSSLILNRNPKYTAKQIYTNLLTNPSPFYTENLGPELFQVLLSKAEEAYRASVGGTKEVGYGDFVTGYKGADDKEAFVQNELGNMSDANAKAFLEWSQKNNAPGRLGEIVSDFLVDKAAGGVNFTVDDWLAEFGWRMNPEEFSAFWKWFSEHSKSMN